MDIFGIDLFMLAFVAGFVVFWGSVFIGFVLFYAKNPYVPRKYYKVKIENREGKWINTVKGWVMKDKGVDYLRIQLKGLPNPKGVHLDASIAEAINVQGELELVESVPDLYEATNYKPKTVPLTQRDRFVEELVNDIIKPLCTVEYKDGEEVKQGYDQRAMEFYKLKAKDALNRNSRIEDLNRSAAVRARIDMVRNQDERKKGGEDAMTKYMPIIMIVVAGLFSYLIMDGANKSFQTTMASQNAVMENGYNQVIQQCGGVYHSINPPKNETKQGGAIPGVDFITT